MGVALIRVLCGLQRNMVFVVYRADGLRVYVFVL